MTCDADTASFDELVRTDEQDLNLAAAALAFAADAYPGLDRAAYLRRLDVMAGEARSGLDAAAGTLQVLARLNVYLFQEQGFAGNREAYGDPRNSYLNEVMDRRLGLPISLSVLYLELAWRLGLRCDGVGFPGHFLVKCAVSGGQAVLDPFNGGVSLDEAQLTRMAVQAMGADRAAREPLSQLITAAGRRSILSRMLRNLKLIHLSRGQHDQALAVLERMLSLDPSSGADYLDRARIYEAMGALRAAQADYRRCLDLVSDAQGEAAIRARIEALGEQVKRLN